MSGLENIVNNDDGEGKIKKQFLEESGFAGFFFGRKTLTDVPVRNSVFDIVRKKDEGDAYQRVGDFCGYEGASCAVGNRKHGEF